MDPPLCSALLAVLEILVLRRPGMGIGTLVVVPPAPRWLALLAGSPVPLGEPFRPTEIFPYLEACLPEAEVLWESGSTSPLHSGLWTERSLEGEDLHLEATALNLEPGSFLLIRRVEAEYLARQQVLQLARERMLDHEKLLKAISAKEVLLHCIVHDLAGPLAGIQGCLEILARGTLDSQASEFVQMGLLQVGRQQRLIEDLLDVFAAEFSSLGQCVTHPDQAPDLLHCVSEAMEGLRPAFLLKKVALRSVIPAGRTSPWRVVADESRLERVLYNLLENALRFAPAQSAVTVHLFDEDPWFSATVVDEGPGVSPDFRPKLFQRFVTSRRQPGKSGLGLFFCRITLERWGGVIAYEPGTGGGARFRIQLKQASAASQAAEESVRPTTTHPPGAGGFAPSSRSRT